VLRDRTGTRFQLDEASIYRMICEAYLDILNRLGVDHECDRQTNGQSGIT